MNVELIAHTQLSEKFRKKINEAIKNYNHTDGQIISMMHIRNCYSPLHPTKIIQAESNRYFGRRAKDGAGDNDANRLIRQIVHSGHTSTLEGLNFDFAIEEVSRALLAQLTRHRVGFSFSVKGQRYVKFGSNDKTKGFAYINPPSITDDKLIPNNDDEDSYVNVSARDIYREAMQDAQYAYDKLRKAGVPPEDARSVLPQSATCDIMMSCNLRALLDFYKKRKHGSGAQWEIADLADELRRCVVEVEPWTDQFFQ